MAQANETEATGSSRGGQSARLQWPGVTQSREGNAPCLASERSLWWCWMVVSEGREGTRGPGREKIGAVLGAPIRPQGRVHDGAQNGAGRWARPLGCCGEDEDDDPTMASSGFGICRMSDGRGPFSPSGVQWASAGITCDSGRTRQSLTRSRAGKAGGRWSLASYQGVGALAAPDRMVLSAGRHPPNPHSALCRVHHLPTSRVMVCCGVVVSWVVSCRAIRTSSVFPCASATAQTGKGAGQC